MTATDAQRLFNAYPEFSKRTGRDIWHNVPKADRHEKCKALINAYLAAGGQIIKAAPTEARGPGRAAIFAKDTKSRAYERDNGRFLNGHDFTKDGPRWTGKVAPTNSASKRNAEHKVGVAHRGFSGAVFDVDGKLQPRRSLAIVDPVAIDLVSDAAEAVSAKRDGKVGDRKLTVVIDDTADTLTDAATGSTISDEMNLLAVDHEHLNRFKLAA